MYDNQGHPVLGANGVQESQAMSDDPEYPGEGLTYDTMNPENNVTMRDTWECKNMIYIEDKHMNQALWKLFLFLFLQEIWQNVEEELLANPNMKLNDMCQSFWDTYGRVTKEEAKDIKDRLTPA